MNGFEIKNAPQHFGMINKTYYVKNNSDIVLYLYHMRNNTIR